MSPSLRIASLNICRTLTYTSLYFRAILLACISVSEPGGPIKIIRYGLRGASVFLSFKTRAISSRIYWTDLVPSSSVMNPLHTAFTPSMCMLFSTTALIASSSTLSISLHLTTESSLDRFSMILSQENWSLYCNKMKLSGRMPIFCKAIACTSVLGKPSMM